MNNFPWHIIRFICLLDERAFGVVPGNSEKQISINRSLRLSVKSVDKSPHLAVARPAHPGV
jgi:hypothetical protein